MDTSGLEPDKGMVEAYWLYIISLHCALSRLRDCSILNDAQTTYRQLLQASRHSCTMQTATLRLDLRALMH